MARPLSALSHGLWIMVEPRKLVRRVVCDDFFDPLAPECFGCLPGNDDCFSYFEADPKTRVIDLHAVLYPEIVRVAWQPATDEIFEDVVDVLESVLPQEPSTVPIPWYRRRVALVGAISFLVLPFLIGTTIIYQSGVSYNWIFYTLAVVVLMILGTFLIKRFELS